jgi:phosphatidylglycerol phospholipase C
MQRISETISSVPPSPTSPSWHKRIILGCWSAVFIPYRNKYLPAYELSLICLFDLKHARQFLHTPNISFNVNRLILMGPLGRGFLEEARAAQHKVYLWTVNAPNLMRWGIRHGVQGIITDDPALYGRVREAWEAEKSGQGKDGVVVNQQLVVDELSFGQRMQIWLVVVIVVLFGWILKRKYHVGVERVQIERKDT